MNISASSLWSWLRGLVVAFLVWSPSAANAVVVRYDFEISGGVGPLSDVVALGYFVFDNDIDPPTLGLTVPNTELLLDFHLTWDGIEYDEATANGGAAFFLPDGTLSSLLFGTNCDDTGSCIEKSASGDWFIVAGLNALIGGLTYTQTGNPGFFSADIVLWETTPIPLPPAAMMLGGGLFALGQLRRRKPQGLPLS